MWRGSSRGKMEEGQQHVSGSDHTVLVPWESSATSVKLSIQNLYQDQYLYSVPYSTGRNAARVFMTQLLVRPACRLQGLLTRSTLLASVCKRFLWQSKRQLTHSLRRERMATLGTAAKKHKVTVVGSGNWYDGDLSRSNIFSAPSLIYRC